MNQSITILIIISVLFFCSCNKKNPPKEIVANIPPAVEKVIYEFNISDPIYNSTFNNYLELKKIKKNQTEVYFYLAKKYSLHSLYKSGTGELFDLGAVGISGKRSISIAEVLLKNTSLIDPQNDYGVLPLLAKLKEVNDKLADYYSVWKPFNNACIKYQNCKINKTATKEMYKQLQEEQNKTKILEKKYAVELKRYSDITQDIDKIVTGVNLSEISKVLLSPKYLYGELQGYGEWPGGDTPSSFIIKMDMDTPSPY